MAESKKLLRDLSTWTPRCFTAENRRGVARARRFCTLTWASLAFVRGRKLQLMLPEPSAWATDSMYSRPGAPFISRSIAGTQADRSARLAGPKPGRFRVGISLAQLPQGFACESSAIAWVALVDGLIHHLIMDPSSFNVLAVRQAAVERFLDSLAHSGLPLLPRITSEEYACLGRQWVCQGFHIPPSP